MGLEENIRRTVRNCGYYFKVQCPKQWEKLALTPDASVRHCDTCRKDVHWCTTDEETIRHARQGHCVARQIPDLQETETLLGEVAEDDRPTAEEIAAWETYRHEQQVDQALAALGAARRTCPKCTYPIPDNEACCRVCR